jgi:peptidoglycan/LPS O-acetylase OafA/YrhL
VFLCLYKDKIINILKKYSFIWIVLLVCGLVYTYDLRKDIYIMNIHSIIFVLLIVVGLTKVKIGNNIIAFLGKHAFSIYILQRIPMIFISIYLTSLNKYVLIILSFVLTAIMAVIFDKMTELLHKKIDLLLS